MLLLVSTTDKLQVITSSAGAIDVHASWMDNVAGSVLPGRANTIITTAATTDVVPPPASTTQRNIKTLHIRNRANSSNNITIQHTDGTVVSQLLQVQLAPEQTQQYIDEIGFLTASGGVSSGFVTGDAKITLKNVADPGWVMMDDGTIGSSSSGSTTRGNSDTQPLFTLLFNNITDAWAPLLTSAGAPTTRGTQSNANTAWVANCRMTLPWQLGRSLAIAGTGASLTARPLGSYIGEETHQLTVAELASHGHNVVNTTSGGGFICELSGGDFLAGGSPGVPFNQAGATAQPTGGDTPHNNMQPTAFWNVMIRL